jgi:hypothetical protein
MSIGGKFAEAFALKPIQTRARKLRAQAELKPKTCGVYFFESPRTGLVKIGRSKNLQKRIGGVQNTKGAPSTELAIWGVIECGEDKLVALEAAMHAAFTGYRVDGEWFALCGGAVLDAAIDAARRICGDDFAVRGLGSDEIPPEKPGWRDPAENDWKRKRRALRGY